MDRRATPLAAPVAGRDGRLVVEARRRRRSRSRLAGGRASGVASRRATPRAHEGCRRRTDGTGFALRTEQGTYRIRAARSSTRPAPGPGSIARQLGEPVPMFAAGPPLFTIIPQNAYTGPSLHAVDGTLLLRPGRDGEAVAGFFPRVKADLATGTAIVPADRVERGLARLAEVVPGPRAHAQGPRLVGRRRLPARYVARDRMERARRRGSCMPSASPATAFSSRPALALSLPTSSLTARRRPRSTPSRFPVSQEASSRTRSSGASSTRSSSPRSGKRDRRPAMPDRNRTYHGVCIGILMLDTRFRAVQRRHRQCAHLAVPSAVPRRARRNAEPRHPARGAGHARRVQGSRG